MSATAPEERPRRADARRNRERILQAARDVFAQYGQVAQIDEIAKRAGVGVGTVYRHFPTKDALMGELIRVKFEDLRAMAIRHQATEDPWEALSGMLWEAAEAMEGDAAQQRMMWAASPAAFELAVPAQQALQQESGKLVARCHEAGVVREDFGVQHIPQLMCAMGSAMALEQRPGPLEHDWRRLFAVILDGLRARP